MSSLPNEERQRAPLEIERARMVGRRGKSARRTNSDKSPRAGEVKGIHE
jgi:hypothetical protein